ncbi:MAG TPA: flippase activity-associated protein Agl23 [Sedimentisphaerales bacterium]|nr:flippase activity-associated protein Agl23 [Sedimentisphaerales bacterium]
MKCSWKCFVLVLAVTITAVAVRVPRLRQRPMHCDEAVNAVKFGQLLETGSYKYEPRQYHGPTLNYFTLSAARLSSAKNFSDVTETDLRIVPAAFGILLVVLVFLLADGLGWAATIFAALLTAVSAAFVFYSRYYIHEMLLVCFTFGVIACLWRCARSGSIIWALSAGVFMGLAACTKETFVISFVSMAAAFVLVFGAGCRDVVKSIKPLHILAALAAAVIITVLFYTSFFSNPAAIADFFRSYSHYLVRAGGDQIHRHPWYYYLKILTYYGYRGSATGGETFIVLLAVTGLVSAVRKANGAGVNLKLVRFIAFYTIIMTLVYSAIPYKTPWCLLGMLHGMILLAGAGAAAIIRSLPNTLSRVLIGLVLAAGLGHLVWQSYLDNYRHYAEPGNPYVYAHTTEDVFVVKQRLETIAGLAPDGHNIYIQVIFAENGYWPLPWYLRNFRRVAWYDHVEPDSGYPEVIIASPGMEQPLAAKLYDLRAEEKRSLYMPLFADYMQLRPGVEFQGFVVKDLWDRFEQYSQRPRMSDSN